MEVEPGKLFIGGISWDTNEERLRNYFHNFGEVLEAVIMRDRTTGRARGFGFVVFADPAVAERVVQERHLIDGRTVEAKKAVPRDDQNMLNRNNSSIHGLPGPARTKKIFVGGLASSVTENDFKKYFEQFGIITDVVVMYDHNTQRPRGFGFITYDSEEAVEKVLQKTFHELNGKLVEVKRAVPKEFSPGPNRSPIVYNHSGRFSNLLNGYAMGHNQNLVGGYGVRMDGRFSPVSGTRSGFPAVGPGYGSGLNFESGLSPRYGINPSFSSNVGYGRGWNPLYGGNSSRVGSPVGYGGGIVGGGSSSLLSSASRNLWGNGSLRFNTDSADASALTGSISGNPGIRSLESIDAIWGSSTNSGPIGELNSTYNSGGLDYGNGNLMFTYTRNSGSSIGPAPSYSASNPDFHRFESISGDPKWHSSPSELEGLGSFGYGTKDAGAEFMAKSATAYGVTNRQTNRGIAA